MQRVRNFLIAQETNPIGRTPTESALQSAILSTGWHKTWDTAVELIAGSTPADDGEDATVVIADQDLSLTVAVFSRKKPDSLADETKWTSVKIPKGDGFWCTFNNSDYGWGWVSGAEREVPFRHHYLQPKAASKSKVSLLSRSRAWVLEVRGWLNGRNKKIG